MSERPQGLRENEPLERLTSMKLGGVARYFASCGSAEEIRCCLKWAARERLRVQILAGGSNTIFTDSFDGLVLKVDLRGVEFEEHGGDYGLVRAAAGESWDGLVLRCIDADLGGIECLSGIPGSVGATPMQNVGAYGQEVADTVVSVIALDRDSLREVTFDNDACCFRYRRSRFKSDDRGRYVITEVVYRLPHNQVPELRYPELQQLLSESEEDFAGLTPGQTASTAVRDAVLTLRRRKSMVVDADDPNSLSVGSFFLNPVLNASQFQRLQQRWEEGEGVGGVPVFEEPSGFKVPAAWLVEQAGFLKGTFRRGACISANHALAIVHAGGGAPAVLALAAEIAEAVQDRFDVQLQPEPDVVT